MESKYKNDLLLDVLLGNAHNEQQLLSKARLFGWDLSQKFRVIVCNIDGFSSLIADFPDEEIRVQEFRQALFRSFERVVLTTCTNAIVGMRSDELILLCPDAKVVSLSGLSDGKGMMKAVLTKFGYYHAGVTFTSGISRPYAGVAGLAIAFDEARRAVRLGRKTWGRGTQIGYEDLGVYLLFDPLRSDEDVIRFYEETIAPVDRYDSEHDGHLVETMTTYFHENYSLTDTANALFVHVNTLKYRLQKVEDVSGYSLSDAEGRLRLQIGMKLRTYLYGES